VDAQKLFRKLDRIIKLLELTTNQSIDSEDQDCTEDLESLKNINFRKERI
jgi:hypothetical protein